ncbi:MAG: hypothetical protein SX243_24030 [Acidobacteriota bacterium]|nr:hypothetical protein [Acidobacteriota bacterium]
MEQRTANHPKPRRRRKLRLLVVGILLVLAAGHIWFWYLPRAHSGVLDAEGAPARVLLGGDFDTAVWLAYPHQNLAAVEGVEDPGEYLAAAARLYRREPLVLPPFGPFSVPPARELAAGWDAGGERFAVAARVYPAFALIGRVAGWVASNPWLSGGVVEGRYGRVQVSWDGLVWSAVSQGAAVPQEGVPQEARMPPSGELLALARLGQRAGVVPPGLYSLRLEEAGLSVDLLSVDLLSEDLPAEGGQMGTSLGGLEDRLEPPVGLLGLAVTEGRRQALVLFDGPSFAVLQDAALQESSDGPSRPPLAGMGLALLLGENGYSGIEGEWQLLAAGREAYDQGATLVGPVSKAFEGWRSDDMQHLVAAVVSNPRRSMEMMDGLAAALRAMPLEDPQLAAGRVDDLEVLLRPLERYGFGSAVILRDPDRAALRLLRHSAPPAS